MKKSLLSSIMLVDIVSLLNFIIEKKNYCSVENGQLEGS